MDHRIHVAPFWSILIIFDPQIWYCNLWKPGNSMNLGDSWDRSPGRSGRQSLSDLHMRLMARDALKKSHPATKIQLWGGVWKSGNPMKSHKIPTPPVQLDVDRLLMIIFSGFGLQFWQMIPMTSVDKPSVLVTPVVSCRNFPSAQLKAALKVITSAIPPRPLGYKNLLCIGVVIHHGSWWKAKKTEHVREIRKIAGDDLTWMMCTRWCHTWQ